MKKIAWLRTAAGMMAVALLSACTLQTDYPDALPVNTAAPPPLVAEQENTFVTELYFRASGEVLVPETRELVLQGDVAREEAIIRALMDGPQDLALSPVFEPRVNLEYLGVQVCGDIALAYFKGSAQTEYDILICKAAIAQSLHAGTGIQYFDMYIDNASPGFRGRPLGTMTPPGTETNVITLQTPPSAGEGAEEQLQENREAVLYFTDTAQELLLCEVRGMQYATNASVDTILSQLMTALVDGPVQTGSMRALPADLRYTGATHRRVLTQEDISQQAASVAVPEEEAATMLTSIPNWGHMSIYLETADTQYDPLLAYGSIIHTVMGYFPRILGIRLFVNGEIVEPESILETTTDSTFAQEGHFSRSDVSALVGNTVQVWYPDKNCLGLVEVQQVLTQGAANDPTRRLRAMFAGEAGRTHLGLPGLYAEDVLGVSIQGPLAVVNLKQGSFEKLNAAVLSNALPTGRANAAQLLVYAIVNTLCAQPGVERVHLLEAGARIENSLGKEGDLERLYLGNALYYSPGLELS